MEDTIIKKIIKFGLCILALLATTYTQTSLVGKIENINPEELTWGKGGTFATVTQKQNNNEMEILINTIKNNKIKEKSKEIIKADFF